MDNSENQNQGVYQAGKKSQENSGHSSDLGPDVPCNMFLHWNKTWITTWYSATGKLNLGLFFCRNNG